MPARLPILSSCGLLCKPVVQSGSLKCDHPIRLDAFPDAFDSRSLLVASLEAAAAFVCAHLLLPRLCLPSMTPRRKR